MRSLILSQWRDLRIGVTREDLGALTTVRQSVRMSKITNDGSTRSDTGCFIAVPIWQQ